MAGIYIHIPFCKQACYYCDFHFSTSLQKKEALIDCLIKELNLRKHEFKTTAVETIYFGGGTPSLLTKEELERIINAVYRHYSVVEQPEITLEANPDDLSTSKIEDLAQSPINRLSIGVQSFNAKDLKLMHRAHNAEEAKHCLEIATQYFKNISVDLIYGIPGLTDAEWIENIKTVLNFNIPHVSCYALTVEPKTALDAFITKGIIPPVDDTVAQQHFEILLALLEKEGFVNYELSNFGKPDFFSKNNTAYWQGKPYLGIGPSAHSFNGNQRSWNIAHNIKYIKAINSGQLPSETEILTPTDKFNEYIMTGLRTVWGVSLQHVQQQFGENYKAYLLKQSQTYINEHLLYLDGDTILTTKKGKFLSDGIASNLFKINLT